MLEIPINGIPDSWLYSNGQYYLFEKYVDDKIIAKGKWEKRKILKMAKVKNYPVNR